MPGIWLDVRFLIVEIIFRAYTSPEILIGKAFLQDKFGSHFCAVFFCTVLFLQLLFVILPLPLPTPLPSHPLESSSILSSTHELFFSEASLFCLIAHLSVHICSVHSALILTKDFHFSYNGLWYTFLSCLCFYANCLDDKALGNPCTSNHHSGWFQGNWLLFWKTL